MAETAWGRLDRCGANPYEQSLATLPFAPEDSRGRVWRLEAGARPAHSGSAQESRRAKTKCPANTESKKRDRSMRSDDTPSLPRPDPDIPPCPPPPQAELKSLLGVVQEHVESAMHEDERLMPTLFTASPDGVYSFESEPLGNGAEAKQFAMTVRLICAAQAARAAVVVVEAWVVPTQPRVCHPWDTSSPKSPRGGDYVVLTGEAADGTYKQCLMPIFRNPHGHFSALGQAVAPPAQPTEPFLARVLPEGPLTPEVRAFAKSLLKDSIGLTDAAVSTTPYSGQNANPRN